MLTLKRKTRSRLTNPPLNSVSSFLLLSFIVISLGQGCSPGTTPNNSQEPSASETIAQINDRRIPVSAYKKRLDQAVSMLPLEIRNNPKAYLDLKNNLLNQLITEELIQQEAAQKKISISEQEIASEVNRLKGSTPEPQWQELLKSRGKTVGDLMETIAHQLLQRKIEEMFVKPRIIKPSNKEIETYYRSQLAKFKVGVQIQLHQIVVAEKKQIEDIKISLEKQEITFADAAKKFSTSPDAISGGNLGWVEEGETVPEFDLAFSIAPNKVSQVIPSSFGYHLLMVTGKKPARTLSLEEARRTIEQELTEDRARSSYQSWILELEKQARIAKNTLLLEDL